MTRVLGQIDQANQALGIRIRVPCDATGNPL
jgi:hypothetical protein